MKKRRKLGRKRKLKIWAKKTKRITDILKEVLKDEHLHHSEDQTRRSH